MTHLPWSGRRLSAAKFANFGNGLASARRWASGLRKSPDNREDGFTLIELLVAVVILPLVAGAICVAMLAVLTQENAVGEQDLEFR